MHRDYKHTLLHASSVLATFIGTNTKARPLGLLAEPTTLLPLPVAPKVVRVGLPRDPRAELDGALHEAGRALQAQHSSRHVPQELLVPDALRLPQVELLCACGSG